MSSMKDHCRLGTIVTSMACVIMMLAVTVVRGEEPADEAAGEKNPGIELGGIRDANPASTGVIKGTVKFEGRQAKRKPVPMSADANCEAMHDDDKPPLKETFVFGENDTLQNVFVYVSSSLAEDQKFDPPAEPAVLDQNGCMYVPHVMGVVAGQTITLLNSDKTTHNVHTNSKENDEFNKAQMPGVELTTIFEEAEMPVIFKCDIHTWMNAYVHVVKHPFFAVTQDKGTFEIRGLPPGEYELTTWHEFKKFKPDQKTYKVTVEAGVAAQVTVTYSPPTKKKK